MASYTHEGSRMKTGEHHINWPYHLRRECCRTGCRRKATQRIWFSRYSRSGTEVNRTYACATHAAWWTVGFYNIRIGQALDL